MSISLAILSAVILGLAVVPFIWPRKIFEYPFVVGMFLAVWLLPQAWAVERGGLAGAFDATLAWTYMTLCVVFLVAGYWGGRLIGTHFAEKNKFKIATMYSEKRMTHASAVLIAVGAIGYVMVGHMQATVDYGTSWTGVITLYALISLCLVFGAALTFIIYLRTKNHAALALFIFSAVLFSPVLLFSVKREFIFEFAIIIFCGLFLVKNFVPSRVAIIIGCLLGAFIVNNAGTLRGYIKNQDTSLIGALTSADVLSGAYDKDHTTAPEITGAVTDIAIAVETGNYQPFKSIYSGLIWRYFPAFIFGRDTKDWLMARAVDDPLSNRYVTGGATRTGFSDTFQDFWYFGALAFASLGLVYGWIFSLSCAGGLRNQYLYVSLLGTGLHAITHAFQEFIGSMPFMLLVIWLPFRYARITSAEKKRLFSSLQPQGGS